MKTVFWGMSLTEPDLPQIGLPLVDDGQMSSGEDG